MGSRNALVTVLLSMMVVGAGAAWYLGRGGDARSQAKLQTSGARDAAAARPDASLAAPGTLAADIPRGAERVEIATPAPEAQPLVATSAAPAHQLHGRVLDPNGRPIQGAKVYASDRRGFPLDFEQGVEVPPYARRATAETDAEGRYALDGLSAGSLRLLARAPGYGPYEEDEIPVPDAATFELADVVLQPGAILSGLVVDPDGAGVGGAKLYLEEGDNFGFRSFYMPGLERRPAAVTDPAGRFRIDELGLGAWNLRVSSADHPERTFEGLAERVGEVLDRRFELERGDIIAGRLLNVPEAERGKLKVRAGPAQSGEFFGFGRSYREATVGPEGDFLVKGLRLDQDYSLQARKDETGGFRFGGFGSSTRSERVEARAGARGVELYYQPEAGVVFQAVDGETEAPVTSFQIQSGFRWREPFLGDDGRPVDEFPEGRARVGNLRPDTSPASLELEIDAVGYETYERTDVKVIAGRDTDLGVIRLKPLPLVQVTVLDAATDQPIAGAEVTLEEEQEEQEGFGRGGFRRAISIEVDDGDEPVRIDDLGRADETDEQGIARLTSLEGKRGKLTVTRDGYAPQEVTGLYMPAGEAVQQLVKLGKGGSARVRVVDDAGDAVSGVRVDHRAPEGGADAFAGFFRGGRGREDAVTDAAGEILFDNLAPGTHRFRLDRPGPGRRSGPVFISMSGEQDEPGWEEVEVQEGQEAALTLIQTPRASLEGRVREAGVELTGANVRVSPEREGGRDGGFDFGGFGGGEGERTDSNGRYALADLEPGRYVLTVSHPKRRMPMDYKVEVKAGENRFDVDLSVAILEGRVTDQQGKPLANVEVRARKASSGGGPRGRAIMMTVDNSGGGDIVTLGDDVGDSVHTDQDGNYSLRGVATDVELAVHASGEGVQEGKSAPVTVAPDQVKRGVDLKLEAAGSVAVSAFKADGSPAGFLMVRASYLDQVPEGTTSSGAEPKFAFLQTGSTKLSGMRPGRWSVSVSHAGPGNDDGAADPEPKEVVVAAGEAAPLTFNLP